MASQQEQKDEVQPGIQDRVEGANNDDVAASTAVELIVPGLNERDSVDEAMDWLFNGKHDAKNMAKKLPYTAQDLRNGIAEPAELLRSLCRVFDVTTKIRAAEDGFQGTVPELIADRLSSLAIPEWWCRNQEMQEWWAKAHLDFARDLHSCFERTKYIFQDDYCGQFFVDKEQIQADFRETCQGWAERVDVALFPGQRFGTFLFFCERLIEDFDAVLVELIEKADFRQASLIEQKHNLKRSLDVVASGALETLKSCWECEVVSSTPNALLWCSKCKVALYCCRDCQKNAWRSGHKQMCEILKQNHNSYLEALKVVDRAHKNGMLEGVRLNFQIDYFLASGVWKQQANSYYSSGRFLVSSSVDAQDLPTEEPRGPSMDIFYENYGRVLRGEFWFYANADNMHEYRTKLGLDPGRDSTNGEEKEYFLMLLFCLLYDIVGFVAKWTSGESLSVREDFMKDMFEHSLAQTAREKFGIDMPVERFKEVYQLMRIHPENDEKRARNQHRSNEKADTLQFIRENFHK